MIGHIHAGNVFVDGECFRLGGYENTLLGYKMKQLFHDCEECVDLIMFGKFCLKGMFIGMLMPVVSIGHLIFEAACGCMLTTVEPSEEDWRKVTDPLVLSALKLIFQVDDQGCFTSTMEKVRCSQGVRNVV